MSKSKIKAGEAVPKFRLMNQHGEMISIEKFIGRPFVIYFYPKDDTPGCTVEACAFRDAFEDFRHLGASVVGISGDSPEAHQKFAKKYGLPFTLLSDPKNEVRRLFGVPKSLFGLLPGRVTYIVDEKGQVKHIFEGQFKARQHVKEAIASLKK